MQRLETENESKYQVQTTIQDADLTTHQLSEFVFLNVTKSEINPLDVENMFGSNTTVDAQRDNHDFIQQHPHA